MATKVGKLEVEVVARMDKLERDLKRVEAKAKKAGETASKSFSGKFLKQLGKMKGKLGALAVGFLSVAGVKGFMALAKNSTAAADSIGKTADKLGLSTDALQEFRFAADQSGVATATLDMAVQRFARRAAEAAVGTGEAKAAIKELGISLHESGGQMRSTEDMFSQAMTTLAKVEDPITRLRLAFKLFDSEGVAIVNMVENFEDLRDTARTMGIVIDENVIRKAEDSKSRLDALGQAVSAELTPIFVAFASGPLVTLARGFASIAKAASDFWSQWADVAMLSMEQSESRLAEHYSELERLQARSIKHMNGAQKEAHRKRILVLDGKIRDLEKHLADMDALEADREDKRKNRGAASSIVPPSEVKAVTARLTAIRKAWEEATIEQIELIRLREKQAIESLGNIEGRELEVANATIQIQQKAQADIDAIRDAAEEKLVEGTKTTQAAVQDEWEGTFEVLKAGFGDAMATMLMTGEMSFKQLGMSFLREVIQKAMKPGIDALFNAIGQFSGQIAGAFASFANINPSGWGLSIGTAHGMGFQGPGRAPDISGVSRYHRGGSMAAGVPAFVGEKGPEMVMPRMGGQVISNSQLARALRGGGGSNVIVNVINTTGEKSKQSESQRSDGVKEIEIMIGNTVASNIHRGGTVDTAIRNSYGINRPGSHGV